MYSLITYFFGDLILLKFLDEPETTKPFNPIFAKNTVDSGCELVHKRLQNNVQNIVFQNKHLRLKLQQRRRSLAMTISSLKCPECIVTII